MLNRAASLRQITWVAVFLLLAFSASAAPKDPGAKKEPRNFLELKIFFSINANEGTIGDGVNEYWTRSENVSVIYSGYFEVKSGVSRTLVGDPVKAQAAMAAMAEAAMKTGKVSPGFADMMKTVDHPEWSTIKSDDIDPTIRVDVVNDSTSVSLDLGEGGSRATETRVQHWSGGRKLPVDSNGTRFILDPDKHTYDFDVRLNLAQAYTPGGKFVDHSQSRRIVGDPSLGGGLSEDTYDKVFLTDARGVPMLMFDIKGEPLPTDNKTIAGQRRIPAGDKGVYIVSWHLTAVPPPLELVITSNEYPTWRPSAYPGPKAGAPLNFKAELRDPVTGDSPAIKVKRFEWELVDTSREPGIALNYPVDCKGDKTPDLKFKLGQGQTSTDPELQKFTEEAPSGYTTRAVVLPFDWGAWATLKVRAILADERVIEGKYLDGYDPVRLPLRRADSYISDKWKDEKGVSGKADADDDEDSPAGNDQKGDGFSLYEEYRGWIVNGTHEEGDPKRKDYFVLNRMGPIAENGLALFARITGLRVHSQLKEDEMRTSIYVDDPGLEYRVMNANRTDKSPRTSKETQHGVILLTEQHGGASEAVGGVESDPAIRPKKIHYIAIDSAALVDGGFVQRKKSNGEVAVYDNLSSTIAHELGHSVGIHHHGTTDLGWVTWVPVYDAAKNAIGYLEGDFPYQGGGEPIEIRSELTLLKMDTAILDHVWRGNKVVYVGCKHGEHSGNETCVMRYDISCAYIPEGQPAVRYITQGETVA